MQKPTYSIKKKLLFFLVIMQALVIALVGRVFYLQAFRADFLQTKAYEQQTRDRLISPNRGSILDRNMIPIATTETVASVSVINSQVQDEEEVARILSEMLELDHAEVLTRVQKRVALERIATKVNKEVADEIRSLNIPGVMVDEDIKRVYPFSTLASQVIGFVGRDNQGIIGLEAKYDALLKGESGKILTETDARGILMDQGTELRIEPRNGYTIVTSIDANIQRYAEQTLEKAVMAKSANRGTIIVMNPQNGEILAMANKPDFDLNDPFSINDEELAAVWDTFTMEEQNKHLNQMWRNFSINDTYEPGSTFKIITSAAGLEENIITVDSMFTCNGSRQVGGRTIRCWRYPRNHGLQNFTQGVQNSCNPIFMEIAEHLGAEIFYKYLDKFGLKEKTGVDLPGEAVGIMHKLDNVGPVELATMSFGQSFQITPLQLLRATSAVINGGYLITPHFALKAIDENGDLVEDLSREKGEQIISRETSDTMREVLESVVSEGTGNKAYLPGYRIGGKTATSEKLPRRSGKYIASFLTFAPADNPQVIALVLIDEPQGVYYGGQVAGPIMKELLDNVLPYLNIETIYTEEELNMENVAKVTLPDFIGQDLEEVKKMLEELNLVPEVEGDGNTVIRHFPRAGEMINQQSRIILFTDSSTN